MKISFSALLRRAKPATVIVHSLDQALYQITVLLDGTDYLLTENDGRTFRRHSLTEVREALQEIPIDTLTLRQTSAYDEMIGQPSRDCDNALELPLSLQIYPPIIRH